MNLHNQCRYIHSTNRVERFNRQVKKAARYKCALPCVDSALHLVEIIAMNATYLHRGMGDLSSDLKLQREFIRYTLLGILPLSGTLPDKN